MAGLYTKQHLPGIGASLGLDRLLTALETLGKIEATSTPASVMVAYFDKHRLDEYVQIAALLRNAGIGVELYPDAKKLGAQLKYADAKGFRLAIVAGSDELDRGACQIKVLERKESVEVEWKDSPESLVARVQELL